MTGKRKRIALLAGQADESYQSAFITGFLKKAFGFDMDVCIFSMYRKYQDTVVREQGDANVFNLIEPEMFDGLVILEDTIQTAGEAQRLEERFHETFQDKPVLVIEKDSPYFPSVFTDGYTAVVELVEHLIVVHGFKDIAFLTGKRWHKHSQERLQAYRDAMAKHGLPVSEDRVIYGDFWYQSGELCAEQLLDKESDLPEAIVCANDPMAIGLCKALTANGVNIPEDIAVLSYDSTFEGQTSPKSLTSSQIPAEEVGDYAAQFIMDKLCGRETAPFNVKSKLLIGESCGCKHTTMPEFSKKRTRWGTEISEEGFDSVSNSMVENLMAQTSLQEYLGTIYSYAYQIRDIRSFHLCLSAPWKGMAHDPKLHLRNNGYPDKMIYAVKYNYNRKDGHVGLLESFERSELLPELSEERDKPFAYFFTPVYCEDQCFGYAAVTYGSEPRSYDDNYRRWIGLVSRGFESLRRYLVMQNVSEQLEKIRSHKFNDLRAVYESLSDGEKHDYELVHKVLEENLFTYRFQPIVNTIDGEIYSYEALMRSKTEKNLPPLLIIKYADMQNRLADVEKATFLNVLKIIEQHREELGKVKIFINSIPGVHVSERDFSTLEDYFAELHDNVVVELTEEAELNDKDLERLKDFFGQYGLETALDDYGTGYSNVTNLLRYMPNYVKIDRALLSEIQDKPQKQHFVREVIEYCHEYGIMALAEGVETTDELRTVIYMGADLIQGYYTGTPSDRFVGTIDEKVRKEIIQFHREKVEGTANQNYIAGKTNRVTLSSLVKLGITEIIVGEGTMVYKDITVIGTPGLRTDIHIRIEDGYEGRLTLEDVYLSNVKKRPCVDIGDNSNVAIVIVGENTLHNTGIHVPESSTLTVEGAGSMKIVLNSPDYYGIGGSADEHHGEIELEPTGNIEILGRGENGVGIGSGLGGSIRINSGTYLIEANGNTAVCIGALTGNADVEIIKSDISLEFTESDGVGVGSLSGNAAVLIESCTFKLYGDCSNGVGIGTIGGERSVTGVMESNSMIGMNGFHMTGIGALEGNTMLETDSSALKLECMGEQALAVGGFNEEQSIVLRNSDTKWTVHNKLDKDVFTKEEDLRVVGGKARFVLNNSDIDRSSAFE